MSQRQIGQARGEDGGHGGSIIIEAQRIVVGHGVILQAGDGGPGGAAEAWGDPHARAQGGKGGDGGVVVLRGLVEGTPIIRHGMGGTGGEAQAKGQAGCEAERSGHGKPSHIETASPELDSADDAEAKGGDGACGAGAVDGGNGGDAYAVGGDGGIGTGARGGDGGDALAVGGTGGDGQNACFDNIADAKAFGHNRTGNGGHGGRYDAFGGNGGPGQVGGAGGTAQGSTRGGAGGNGTSISASRHLLRQDLAANQLIEAGVGGNAHGGDLRSGDGGRGLAGSGGGGGSSAGHSFAGATGGACTIHRDPSDAAIPVGSVAILAIGLILLSMRRRGAC